jgi:hypothetical protein
VPTLPNVPRQPRGELNSACVLICVGGLLLGDSAVDPVVSIVSHRCLDGIVARSDCMFVCGTTPNVQVISPPVGGGGFGSRGLTWIVAVPRQVRVRNGVCPDGQVGVASRPHLATAEATRIAIAGFWVSYDRSFLDHGFRSPWLHHESIDLRIVTPDADQFDDDTPRASAHERTAGPSAWASRKTRRTSPKALRVRRPEVIAFTLTKIM